MIQLTIDLNHSIGIINPNVYGHFVENLGGVIDDGVWVGENSPAENIRGFRKKLVESFCKIHPPVIRWPGGCSAEVYDWRDGIGPRSQRPIRLNWWYHHDQRYEYNQVGTHEIVDFCCMVGAEPYMAANIATVPPLHIRNWIEYCNFPQGSTALAMEREANGDAAPFLIRYWGVGNENWAGGGNMSPEMYMQEYIRYATACRSTWTPDMRFIFCGGDTKKVEWTRRIMQEYASRDGHLVPAYGMSIHHYCYTKECFVHTEDEWYDALFQAAQMQCVVDQHRAAMDEFDPERKIKLIVDEWGNWCSDGCGPSGGKNLYEQQSTMRDAVMAAVTLNILNNRCDVVDMANVAQLCNCIQSLYLAAGEQLVETPVYHVFDMFQAHQGAQQHPVLYLGEHLTREGFDPTPVISASASEIQGRLTVTLANLHMTQAKEISLALPENIPCKRAKLTMLTHADVNACNTFQNPHTLIPEQQDIALNEARAFLTMPPASVAVLTVPLAG